MSPVREMKDGRGKCIFYGSLPQETGGLTPMLTRVTELHMKPWHFLKYKTSGQNPLHWMQISIILIIIVELSLSLSLSLSVSLSLSLSLCVCVLQ